MKLHIAYNVKSLDEALSLAQNTAQYAHGLVVGPLLLFKEGVKAITSFRKQFPTHEIVADAKICDRAEESVTLFAEAGADVITVLAGTSNETIFTAAQTAHKFRKKICLDLLDSYSMGQSAHDARNLGVDTIIFHRPHESAQIVSILDEWDTTRGNTDVPIFIAGNLSRTNIGRALALKPDGILVGRAIIYAQDPAAEAAFFRSLLD